MHGPGDGDHNQKVSVLEERLLKARNDPAVREELIDENQTYILKVASKICIRNITRQDDEYSVALLGFNEAINSYRSDQSTKFHSFAFTVIRRRLTDYFRSETRHFNQVPLVSADSKDNEPTYPEVIRKAFEEHHDRELEEKRRSDLEEFAKHLQRFKISLNDLVKISPKHRDTRQNLQEIARRIASKKELLEQFYKQKRLKKGFAEQVGCHRRTLKRHRNYLIALVVVLVEDLPTIREYLGLSAADRKGGGDGAERNFDGGQ
ncbi:RNA polymerase sigma factor [Kroppenstedtia eburnea]|uniref:RNA polymerase sigma factor SigI n=1 Tax=Kroppenstedtia eburnea TaxID=714067 RepID=A0A1N7Q7F9_9BACL|nr:RNA polymerase sigma factor [Kroppenstedtia eburnea]